MVSTSNHQQKKVSAAARDNFERACGDLFPRQTTTTPVPSPFFRVSFTTPTPQQLATHPHYARPTPPAPSGSDWELYRLRSENKVLKGELAQARKQLQQKERELRGRDQVKLELNKMVKDLEELVKIKKVQLKEARDELLKERAGKAVVVATTYMSLRTRTVKKVKGQQDLKVFPVPRPSSPVASSSCQVMVAQPARTASPAPAMAPPPVTLAITASLPPHLTPDDSAEGCARRRQVVLDVLEEMEAEHRRLQLQAIAPAPVAAPAPRQYKLEPPPPPPQVASSYRLVNRPPTPAVRQYCLRKSSAQTQTGTPSLFGEIGRKLSCLDCHSLHFGTTTLKGHMIKKHGKVIGRLNRFGCSGCAKTFYSQVEFRDHFCGVYKLEN